MNMNLGTIILAVALAVPLAQAGDNERFARVVLVIPPDADAPENFGPRLDSLARRAEGFFAKWMRHWKFPIERPDIFARKKDGEVAVTLVKVELTNANGREALPELRQKSIRAASEKLGLKPGAEVVWWVLYDYPGVKGFQGGSRNFGGVAINAYPPGIDPIGPDADLASPELAAMAIKGTIHELGHALGLPHIGPRPDVKLGNTLMGPVNRAFWSKSGTDDPRVYLSQVSAAALWKHPIFRKGATPNPPMPGEVEVSSLTITDGPDGKAITVRGQLTADPKAHTAVLLDSARGRFGDYWERSYLGKIDTETGTFEIVVSAPFARGALFLSFCFPSGVNTSNGKMPFQRGSAIVIPYETKDRKRQFTMPGDSG